MGQNLGKAPFFPNRTPRCSAIKRNNDLPESLDLVNMETPGLKKNVCPAEEETHLRNGHQETKLIKNLLRGFYEKYPGEGEFK